MNRAAVIVYHKNLGMYPGYWINDFKQSIFRQTIKEDFDILEVNYGGTQERIFYGSDLYQSIKMPTFVHAMNYLLDKSVNIGYECVFNTNVDDKYGTNRFKKQIEKIEQGYDIVSSNFNLIKDDKIVHEHKFHGLDLKAELDRDHNIICHPVVAYSKKFIKENRYIPEEIPFEDMLLWKRSLEKGYKFAILEDVLCFHRLHQKSVGHNEKELS